MLNIYRGKTLVLAFTFFLKHLFTAHDRHGRTTYELEFFVLQVVSGLLDKLNINCGEKMLQERALRNILLQKTINGVVVFSFSKMLLEVLKPSTTHAWSTQL